MCGRKLGIQFVALPFRPTRLNGFSVTLGGTGCVVLRVYTFCGSLRETWAYRFVLLRSVHAQVAALGAELEKSEHELRRRRREAKEHVQQMKVPQTFVASQLSCCFLANLCPERCARRTTHFFAALRDGDRSMLPYGIGVQTMSRRESEAGGRGFTTAPAHLGYATENCQ